MAEQTLALKIDSAYTQLGYTFTTDEKDSFLADALREFSQAIPRKRSDTSNTTDGSTTSFNLPSDFMALNAWSDLTDTGVQLYATGDTSVDTSDDVDLRDFDIIRELTSTMDFHSAPASGQTLKVYYSGVWTTATLPREYDQAVKYFALHFAQTQSKAYGGEVQSESEDTISKTYKSGDDVQYVDYYKLALNEINRLQRGDLERGIYSSIHAVRV